MKYNIWDDKSERMLTQREKEYFFPGADGVLKRIKQQVGSAQAGKTILFTSSLDKCQVLVTYLEDAEPRYKLVMIDELAMAYNEEEEAIIESIVERALSEFNLSDHTIHKITENVVEMLKGEEISRESVSDKIAKYLEQ